MNVACALHVHSNYSDGEFTLAELRDVYLAERRHAVLLADHAEYFDAARLREYTAECERLSDSRLRLIPGLEYSCDDRMHIVGYGVTALTKATHAEHVIAHIAAQDGVSVIAHPRNDHFERIEALQHLPTGIEAWNTKYDGRYAPRAKTFELIERLRLREPRILAFFGSDLHWRQQFRGLVVHVSTASNQRDDLLAALREGAFEARRGAHVLSPKLSPSVAELRAFRRRHGASRLLWHSVRAVIRVSGGVAARLPSPIKARLRRIF